ncbi:MAG: hypothetical protein QM762_24930 [Chryseolinea sp.]
MKGFRDAGFQVTALVDQPSNVFSANRIDDPAVKYVSSTPGNSTVQRIISYAERFTMGAKERQLMTPKARKFIKAIHANPADVVIAVDFFALWCAQQLNLKAHLVSLEILEGDGYYSACDLSKVESVIIQSNIRFHHLFRNREVPLFILPNSPKFLNISRDNTMRLRTSLVYCGSALAEFGVFSCLDFLADYAQYTLTLKGNIPKVTRDSIDLFYSNLLTEGRLILDDSYLDDRELTEYLAQFRIGLVFYDCYRFSNMRRFNFYTGPAGKLYQYFNAALPVIGNRLKGFEVVESNKCGVLINNITSLQIMHAIEQIEMDYVGMTIRSKETAREYDVEKYVREVINGVSEISLRGK